MKAFPEHHQQFGAQMPEASWQRPEVSDSAVLGRLHHPREPVEHLPIYQEKHMPQMSQEQNAARYAPESFKPSYGMVADGGAPRSMGAPGHLRHHD